MNICGHEGDTYTIYVKSTGHCVDICENCFIKNPSIRDENAPDNSACYVADDMIINFVGVDTCGSQV